MTDLNRREFLTATLAGLASASVLAACTTSSPASSPSSSSSSPRRSSGAPGSSSSSTTEALPASTVPATTGSPTTVPNFPDRRLVVIEMTGGNDGLSTVVPYGIGAYHDARQRIGINAEDLVILNDQLGLHQSLASLQSRGLAIVQGIGVPNPDGSHFAMMDRWWMGDAKGRGTETTGFLGRLADSIGDPAARAVALSIGSGSHPALRSRKAVTLSIPRADIARALVGARESEVSRYAFQEALKQMAVPSASDIAGIALSRSSSGNAIGFASTLQSLPEDTAQGYPDGTLGDGLRLTARLLHADPLIRIVHVPMGVDFDAHHDKTGHHAELLQTLAAAVGAFMDDLAQRDLSDQVLVATISEFGRRLHDNASNGSDHGTASCAFLLGPVRPGLHGEYSSLTKLDRDDQLIATMGFDQYYATIAESWFGVPARDVLAGGAKRIPDLLAV